MKLINEKNISKSSGVESRFNYRVANTPEIMALLSSLYEDPILAPIRELATNAWDSHIMAKNTNKSFDVCLPTLNNLEYSIRDYGTGLSPKHLEKMYSTYGVSDKSDSNDFNGCMGVGSKSPFAYTNVFTTTSYFNGKEYIYVNAKDEDGIPNINRMSVRDTKQPNGLKVSFGVSEDDIHDFQDKAIEVYEYFPKKPNFVRSISEIDFGKDEPLIKGDNWSIYEYADPVVVMGFIGYPIDSSYFPDYENLIDSGLCITVPIGSVSMTPSRDALKYNNHTKGNLNKIFEEVLKELSKKISNNFKSCKSYWEACRELYKCKYGEYRFISDIFDNTDFYWKKKKVYATLKIPNDKTSLIVFYNSKIAEKLGYKRYRELYCARDYVFYFADMKRGNYAAVQRDMLVNDISHAILVDKEQRDMLGVKCKLCSSVKKYKITKRKRAYEGYLLKKSSYCRKDCWKLTDLDVGSGGIYVEINNYNIYHTKYSTYNTNWIKDLLEIDVYGIKTKYIDKFKKLDNWIHFDEFVKDKLIKKYDENIDDYLKYKLKQSVSNFFTLSEKIDGCELFDEVKECNKQFSSEMCDMMRKLEQLSIIDKKEIRYDLSNGIYNKYPMLKLIDSHYMNSVEVINYIEEKK